MSFVIFFLPPMVRDCDGSFCLKHPMMIIPEQSLQYGWPAQGLSCLYICLCVHHVHVKASLWVKTISIQPAFSVFISIIIAWHCWTLWLSWAGNREWEIMYSNRREIMSSYGAISKWPSGKWLPRPQKWMKKNSDKFHSPSDMLFRRFGGFCDPGDQSSQWKINSPKNFHAQGGRRISLYFLRYEIEIRLRAVYLIVSCLKGWTGGFRFFIDTKKDLLCADKICMIDKY